MKKAVLFVLSLCLLVPAVVRADNLAGDYTPAPSNTLLSLLYYNYVTADKIDLTENLFLLREVYYFDIGPVRADIQFILPFGHAALDTTSGGLSDSSSGIGDLILLSTFWFVHNDQTKTYFGFSPYFFLPTGDYDKNQALNLGSNRWAFREEFNITKGFTVTPEHTLWLELTTGVDFFTDNDEVRGGNKLSRDPLYNLESHVGYDLTKTLRLYLDYYGHWGGATALDDVDQHDTTKTQSLGTTLVYNFAPQWQFLVQYRKDVYVDDGPEAQVIQARLFYATDFGKLFH